MSGSVAKQITASPRADKPREYFSVLLDVSEDEIDYSEIAPTTAAQWRNAEVLLPVTVEEFQAVKRFIEKHRRKSANLSHTYELFSQAIAEKKQIVCVYQRYRRELCPIVLGHSQGEEKALTFQFGGESATGLPPGGQWRCLFLSRVADAQLRDGPWYAGDSHTQPQGCVEIVDLDVNPKSPYNPKRRLPAAASSGRRRR